MLDNKSEKVELYSGWKFALCDSPEARKLKLFSSIAPSEYYEAEIPGTIHTDLLRNNIIDDPFYSDNEKKVYGISNCDWIYQNNFDFDKNDDSEYEIIFEGLDTLAEIKLNDYALGKTSNMFCMHKFNITEFLKKGENKLEVKFTSPENFSKKEEDKYGKLRVALNSNRVYLRKAQYSFGWDWGPILTTSGIWKKVYIEKKRKNRIKGITFNTLKLDENKAQVKIGVTLDYRVNDKLWIEINLVKDNNVITEKIEVSEIKNNIEVSVPSPALWFPNGAGEQSLYNLEITLNDEYNVIEHLERKVGIRTIELITNSDGRNDFAFRVNGKIIFAKGANWIPADSFLPRVKNTKYLQLLNFMKEANMNMVRVWGGGIYENNEFYEYCDELGLMVWQDFMFACASYPEHSEFLNNVENEVEQNIYRLQYHPSIAIWCGNNENEWIWYQVQKKSITQMPGFKIFHRLIPKKLKEIDQLANYWQSSPFGFEDDPNDEASGNRHQWQIWSHWIDYKKVINDNSLFVTEFGFQAPANLSTFNKCLPKESRSVQNAVFEFHNKQVEGPERIFKFLSSHLPISTDWNHYNYLTQLNQGLALQTCIGHWRANERTNGSIIWQINDCWPVTSWSLIDSDTKPKMAYYFVKNIFSHIGVTFNEKDKKIIVINDTSDNFKGKLKVVIVSSGTGEIIESFVHEIEVESYAKFEVPVEDNISNNDNNIIVATIYDLSDKIINRNLWNLREWKHSKLKPAGIKIIKKENKLVITSEQPAFYIDLFHPDIDFSDRGFTLLPDEKNTVSIVGNNTLLDQNKINVLSLNDFLTDNE